MEEEEGKACSDINLTRACRPGRGAPQGHPLVFSVDAHVKQRNYPARRGAGGGRQCTDKCGGLRGKQPARSSQHQQSLRILDAYSEKSLIRLQLN